MAICGGTNSLVHLQSCCHEADVHCTLDMWDEVSRRVPALVAVSPSGPYVLYDMHKAGGVPAVMRRIENYLDLSRPTVTGKTVGENREGVKLVDSDVIRPLDNPVWPEGALAVLKGNLAPRGAVTRHTVVDNKELLTAVFKARVFDSIAEVTEAITTKKINARDAVICRYQGPRGGPAMMECLRIIMALKANRIRDVAVITDGRFSGWTKGYLAIGNVCPEAQVGGPLAFVQNGDPIRIHVPNRRLDVDISEEEMARRKARWNPPDQSKIVGTLLMYATTALQADQGAGWPVRWGDLDKR